MITFEISINGKRYCESEDITILTLVAEEIQRRAGHRISLHTRTAAEGPLQQLAANLGVGDEIAVRIVDVLDDDKSDPQGCTFCGRDVHDVSDLVQGPAAAICDRCVLEFSHALKNGSTLPVGGSIRTEPEWVCGFCAKQPGSIPGVVVRNGAAVCPECLRACSDIMAPGDDKDLSDAD